MNPWHRRADVDDAIGTVSISRKVEKDADPAAAGACPRCGRVIGPPKTESGSRLVHVPPPLLLPRPWEPATCHTPQLRKQLWSWLDAVVAWLLNEYVWEVADTIPACWQQHPHLVHEIAVLADQRRRAGHAFTSDALEEWHRYNLPTFTERMRSRLRNHCEDGHQTWPANGRYTRYMAEISRRTREDSFAADVGSVRPTEPKGRRRLGLVDLDTGEINDL